ncbi:dimethylamine/trimethylamine dehydrogenase [Roseovarius nanhaiticus]|uniref:Dimethylamine/trimethylamine dehydrogenase n=1 Tax=Roseovarius nanhaiticus TaxID=573024 RepID=A0A1N7F9U3_9RHOB|nr:FAD-dependent oxidoreductase [Roseovarius nanhaiticus]SEK58951.1 dimethylamine/trimethylamine dehydrogenase [Roseovarius nanhaiticus]SIR97074.1 dimethylamine/trimethylamine dehydrogenase [Roseovarius nanhaiticus]
MSASPYAALFEPVKIGPVTAPSRFYQVPHCSGMGHLRPQADAAMRGMKAAGGWGVVCNQETEIHPTSDLSPYPEGRLWDRDDIPALRLMTDAIHAHGALAGIELAHNGAHAANLMTRAPVLAPSEASIETLYPKQARMMDRTDICNLRAWHRQAAINAREAGFDIIYVYAGHEMVLPQHFMLPRLNQRSDEYGGSLENRVRLARELLEETKEAVGDTCAVAFRFAVDEMAGAGGMEAGGEGLEVIKMLADLPDLWDVNVSGWQNDSVTTRFQPEDGYQNSYIAAVKDITQRPVVGVGRLTSPDLMLSMVQKGIVDFIGAARPSIADPFLPAKIRDGRVEEIRECIGCNICVSSDTHAIPIRCTQNPTMGEEWRRGWHPEEIEPVEASGGALVIGAGPAGLECAMQLARRGMDVTLADAGEGMGGRVTREGTLSGLGAWTRVMEHRLYDLRQRGNVQMFTQSRLDADQVAELGLPHVFVATGARWRRDGVGRRHLEAFPVDAAMPILTPDDIMDGAAPPNGPVVIYDDEQIYMGGVLALHLAEAGRDVTLITPAAIVSPWTQMTLEQDRVQRGLIAAGVSTCTGRTMAQIGAGACTTHGIYGEAERTHDCASVVMVTGRARDTALYDALMAMREEGKIALETLQLIGDAAQPGLIADAVYSGHAAARALGQDAGAVEAAFFRREMTALS